MLPLFDENPTSSTPFVTWFLIAVSIAVHLSGGFGATVDAAPGTDDRTGTQTDGDQATGALSQQTDLSDDLETALRWAAIPCEIVQGRPLTIAEVDATYGGTADARACRSEADGPALFPDKPVVLAMVSSIFLHAGALHLGLNMLFLWVFGNNVEDRLGHVGFLVFYLLAGVVGTVAYTAFLPLGTVPILGASGAVAGVMGGYLIWYPDAPIRTLVFLILVDIRARWFLIAWFGIQFFTIASPGAWIAHVAGFVFGAIAGRIIRKVQPLLRLRPGQRAPAWDETGGAGHGPYPHLDEVWDEPHHERYE